MRSRKWIGLELVGFSSREANRISLFSTVAGGGLVGRGALARRSRAGSGAGGGVLCDGMPLVADGGVGVGTADLGTGICGRLGTGFLVPGGATGSSVWVYVAARTGGDATWLADFGARGLKGSGPRRRLDGPQEQRVRRAESTDFDFPILRSHVIPLVRPGMITGISGEVASPAGTTLGPGVGIGRVDSGHWT